MAIAANAWGLPSSFLAKNAARNNTHAGTTVFLGLDLMLPNSDTRFLFGTSTFRVPQSATDITDDTEGLAHFVTSKNMAIDIVTHTRGYGAAFHIHDQSARETSRLPDDPATSAEPPS